MEKLQEEGKETSKLDMKCSGCLMCKAFKSLQLFKNGEISLSPSVINTLKSCREIFDTLLLLADDRRRCPMAEGNQSCMCVASCNLREQKDVAVSTSIQDIQKPKPVEKEPEPVEKEPEPVKNEPEPKVPKEEPVEIAQEVTETPPTEPLPQNTKPNACKCKPEKPKPKVCKCKPDKSKQGKPRDKKAKFKDGDVEYIKVPCHCKKDVKSDKTKNLCECPPVIIFDKPPAKRNFFEMIKCLLPGETLRFGKCACDEPEKKASLASNYTIETLSYSNKDPSSAATMASKTHAREIQNNRDEGFVSNHHAKRNTTAINNGYLNRKTQDTKQINFLLYETMMNLPFENSMSEKFLSVKYRKTEIDCKFLRHGESGDNAFQGSDELKNLKLRCRYMRSYSELDYSQYDMKEIFEKFQAHKRQQSNWNYHCYQARHRTARNRVSLSNRLIKMSKFKLFCLVLVHDFNVKLFIMSYMVCLTYFVTSLWLFH